MMRIHVDKLASVTRNGLSNAERVEFPRVDGCAILAAPYI